MSGEPTLSSLLERALGESGGWGDLDEKSVGKLLEKMQSRQRAAMKREANVFRDCFSTDDGRKVLELFLDTTLRSEETPINAFADAQMLNAALLYDRAQRDFVRAILGAIAIAENEDLPQEEDED